MNIDLSCKSICELCFDRAQATAEEALVASRVQTLTARHNRIERIVGLGALFHSLTHLDLAHNNLSAVSDGGAWLAALPPSLCALNISHNGLCGFSSSSSSDAVWKGGSDVGGPHAVTVAAVEATLGRLRRTCPLTLALFFSRGRFPQLRELDISHNTLRLTLAESDAVEKKWLDAVERPSAACVLGADEHAVWRQRTTCAVEVLRLDGNVHLSALNGMLCGMEAVTHLHAMGTGVADLTALSAAATFCPKLRCLDMRKSPVVDAFVRAPRATIVTFVELLLLPALLEKAVNYEQWEGEEGRVALQRTLREVTHRHMDDIEAAVLNQQGCGGDNLPRVLYAALLQQVIPQVVELDDGINVDAVRRGFMNAAQEVLQRFIDMNDRRDMRCNKTLKQDRFIVDDVCPSVEEGNKEEQQLPNVTQQRQGTSHTDVDASTSLSSTSQVMNGPRKSSPVVRKGRAFLSSSVVVGDTAVGRSGRERSRSAHGISMAAAAAAASAQLRPAVLVTKNPTSGVPATSENSQNDSNNVHREYEPVTTVSTINAHRSNNDGYGGVALDSRRGATRQERQKVAPHSPLSSSTSPTAVAIVDTQGDNSSGCEESGSSGRFQRALAALTPLLVQRLRGEGVPNKHAVMNGNNRSSRDDPNNSAASTTITYTSTTNTSAAYEALVEKARALEETLLGSQERQRGMQESVLRLKEQLQQDRRLISDQRKEALRLRHELDALIAANKRTKQKLKKRQKEIAYGTAALQRQEVVAQRKAALEHIAQEEKSLQQAERRLREKMALSRVWSYSQMASPTGILEGDGGETTMGARSNGPHVLRKTRADLLRETAVRERMEIMKRDEPLAYNVRRFRPGEFPLNGVEEGGNYRRSSTTAVAALHRQEPEEQQRSTCDRRQGEERIHGKTPWRSRKLRRSRSSSGDAASSARTTEAVEEQQSLYDKGYNPYYDDKSEGEGIHHHRWIQELSLQQLFEEAAALQQRQHILQQRVRDVGLGGNTEGMHETNKESHMVVHHEPINGDFCVRSGETRVPLATKTPQTCIAALQENKGPASFVTADDSSWSGAHNPSSTPNKKDNDKNNDDEDDDDSVDIVVSVAENQTHNDFIVSVVSPSLVNEEGSVGPQPQQQEQQTKANDPLVPSGPPPSPPAAPRAAEEHFSVDARSIYAEIMRQRQQQQQQQQQQQSKTKETLEIPGTVIDEVGEPSPVAVAIEGEPSSLCKGAGSRGLADAEENCDESGADGGVETTTRRALFS
ncbi:hypothetical protein DQ04_00241130 [Trypanosoma grayi]|uniref:hypothetical protein n=1 Tax=Trypanosoma grayi TaxID=71804 RepID=UPI0004F4B47F|nr:hypothetical protein DQ04_00241130 [Trypanosoma grayi]KEG14971.1 hypothetical protein DQ04_00241130 [Trypanosoma grayi]